MSTVFEKSPAPVGVKLDNFPKYVRRQSLARFLARYELFKLQLDVQGSVIECGVHHGGGLFTWAKLSSALEPYAIHRRIYGFDTFSGFPQLSPADTPTEPQPAAIVGGFAPGYPIDEELDHAIIEYDANRYLSQFRKVELVKGDAVKTIPAFLERNPQLLVSLLFLDFDLYEPTRTALEHLRPRMCKGAVIAFDEINNPLWPGETVALLETVQVAKHRLRRFPMDPNISYVVL
jgi:hypothetical protein